jgi:pyrroloquinoline-quinone synthase
MFSKVLLQEIEQWHLLKHPFYQAWMAGTLSREQLKDYAIQYFPHVDAFPRYVSTVHSQCTDRKARLELAHNLADEEGLTGGRPHPELWLDFAESLGAARNEVENSQVKPAAQKMADGFFELTRASYAQGLAALVAYEYQVPAIANTKIEGLQKNYGLSSDKALKFFQVHEKADVYHSEACLRALDAIPPEHQAAAIESAKAASKLLWDFLSEAYDAA